jgi:hypothetical protein
MCFDLQGHKTTEHTIDQGRPFQASRLRLVRSWHIYRVEDNRHVWDRTLYGPRGNYHVL